METNWAAEHLQTIRTLMERSALYRRALAPIMTYIGVLGIAAGVVGWKTRIPLAGPFSWFWMSIAIVAVMGAFVIVRKQAIQTGESFWSPPTRRVAQAMLPALLIGLALGLLLGIDDWKDTGAVLIVIPWTLLYGLALHAGGFFVNRGIRLFAWGFFVIGLALCFLLPAGPTSILSNPHLLMGAVFGATHLAYGIYLFFTERKNEA